MKTIRWGIIGCGDVTEVKSGPALQKADHSALVAVMRRDGARAAEYARRHDVPMWYDDARALLRDPSVDAVYVATPPSSHLEYTLLAAEAGKPVLVEKPMALDYAECRRMIDACHAAEVPLFVAYYRRALPRFLKVKELVDSGAVGKVRAVTVTLTQRPLDVPAAAALPWRVVPEIAGGGLFMDLAAHMLDFLDFVLGPIRDAHGWAANQADLYPAEDVVSGSFTFESGVQGVGLWCFAASEDVDRTEIIGSVGTLTFTHFDTSPVRLTSAQGATEFVLDNPPHVHQPLVQTIVDQLNGTGACPSTGESAARTAWVMDRLRAR